jgi:CelD/BcsL family acetyltransferase involved in cellulose biosynthesis
LRVLAVRDGGRLVALAPLFLWGFGGRPPLVRVSLLGAGISDHAGMVARPLYELPAARAVFDHLVETASDWHVCEWEELRPGSPLLRAEPPARLLVTQAPSSVCPFLPLQGSMDALLGGLSPKFRKNLRQAESRLRRMGAEFVTASAENAGEFLAALFRLHAARWREKSEPGMLRGDAVRQFHLEAARRLMRQGLLRLNAIRLEGAIVAVQHNLWHRRRLSYYLSGFDPAHARYSPGAVLLGWSIRTAIAEGGVEVDFLRHREPYKYQWGARDRVNRRLLVAHSATYARDVA